MINTDISDLAKNKLYLLKILDLAQGKIQVKDLSQFVLEKEKMNYFFLMQYLQELTQAGLIQRKGQDLLLCQGAYDSLDWFGDQICQGEIDEIEYFLNSKNQAIFQAFEEEDFFILQKTREGNLLMEVRVQKDQLEDGSFEELSKRTESFFNQIEKIHPKKDRL